MYVNIGMTLIYWGHYIILSRYIMYKIASMLEKGSGRAISQITSQVWRPVYAFDDYRGM